MKHIVLSSFCCFWSLGLVLGILDSAQSQWHDMPGTDSKRNANSVPSVLTSSCSKCCSRPRGFEFLHAYISWYAVGFDMVWHITLYLGMGFETLNLEFCELTLWKLTVIHPRTWTGTIIPPRHIDGRGIGFGLPVHWTWRFRSWFRLSNCSNS